MLNFPLTSLLLLVISLVVSGFSAYQPTQTVYAATLTIIQDGVTIQRANTQAWLPVRAGAVMPFGEGDRAQTTAEGRVLIEFWTGSNMLLLPYSTYQQGRLVYAEDGNQIEGRLVGTAIHRFADPVTNYRLELNDGVITEPAQQFATWSSSTLPDSVTVYEGMVTLDTDGTSLTIPENQGWQAGKMPVSLEDRLNAAVLTTLHEGCESEVTITERALRVRGGPGLGYIVMGDFANGDRITVVGINQSGGWYRVRLNSHFGWVEALAVQALCADLPRLPDNTQEVFVQVFQATELEQDWLRPYFGSPRDDPWFYRLPL